MISNVYNTDNLDFMRKCASKKYDLAIVDPPYGINAAKMSMGQNLNRGDGWKRGESTSTKARKGRLNSGGGHMKNSALVTMNCDWDLAIPTQEYFDELFRISKNQIIWGGNYFPLPPTRCIVCWDKVQPWPNFSQWEMAWTSFDKPAKLFRFSNTGGKFDRGKIHPTQKPIELYKYLIKEFAQPGDIIIDTNLGSGNSRIAADEMGYDFDGIEIDPGYFAAHENLWSMYKSQLNLFQ